MTTPDHSYPTGDPRTQWEIDQAAKGMGKAFSSGRRRAFDPTALKKPANTQESENGECLTRLATTRSRGERQALKTAKVDLDGLLAVLDFDGLAEFGGSARVGETWVTRENKETGGLEGRFFWDCSHYCAPGIPDEYARVLYNMLMNHPQMQQQGGSASGVAAPAHSDLRV